MASLSVSKFEPVFSTLPTKFIWQYQDSNGSWITFDRSTTRKLDAAYKTSSSSGAVDIKIKKDQIMSCTFSGKEEIERERAMQYIVVFVYSLTFNSLSSLIFYPSSSLSIYRFFFFKQT